MTWLVVAASLFYVPNVPGGVIGPNPSLFSGPSSGGSSTTGALLLVDGVSNVLLVDGTDNLCLTGSSSC